MHHFDSIPTEALSIMRRQGIGSLRHVYDQSEGLSNVNHILLFALFVKNRNMLWMRKLMP